MFWFPRDVYELPHWPAKEAGTESDPMANYAPPSLYSFSSPTVVLGGKVEFASFLGVWMSYTCILQTCAKYSIRAQILSSIFSLSWVSWEKEPFTWLFLWLFEMKVFTGRESCFKRHKVTPLGAVLSEIASKENNGSYSSRLWAQGQT